MIGVCCPVWRETRYLPLVLEQMMFCSGPKIVVWQDQPLYWLSDKPCPSGWDSHVKDILPMFPAIKVVRIKKGDHGDETEPFGGFLRIAQECFAMLAALGADKVLWFDSDWLFSIADLPELYDKIETCATPLVGVQARHYWRDFAHTMSTGNVTVSRPASNSALLAHYEEKDITRFDTILYHPAYVLTDDEMYHKVNSWGHAPLFKERRFYEDEWLAHDDAKVNPQPADPPPSDVLFRLKRWGALP